MKKIRAGFGETVFLIVVSLIERAVREICIKKKLSYILASMMIILSFSYASGQTEYVNITHPDCSNDYARINATNPSTPWCDLQAALDNLQSNDIVFVSDGTYRNQNGYALSYKNLRPGAIIKAQSEKTILTSRFKEFETRNSNWRNESKDDLNIWSTTKIGIASTTVGCYYMTDNRPLYPHKHELDLTNKSLPEGTFWDEANQILKIRFDGTKNPNEISLECFANDVIRLTAVNNLQIDGFTIRGGFRLIKSSVYVNNITISENKLMGGLSDTGAIDLRDGHGINIIFNSITRNQPQTWWWDLMKNGLHTETSAIYMEDGKENISIENNKINGYFNGILLFTSLLGKYKNAAIRYNEISNIYDDSVELEDYANGYNVSHNNISNYFVAFSMSPADSTQARSYVNNNWMQDPKTIQFTQTKLNHGSEFKLMDGGMKNFDISNNMIGELPSNTTATNISLEETNTTQNQTNATTPTQNTTITPSNTTANSTYNVTNQTNNTNQSATNTTSNMTAPINSTIQANYSNNTTMNITNPTTDLLLNSSNSNITTQTNISQNMTTASNQTTYSGNNATNNNITNSSSNPNNSIIETQYAANLPSESTTGGGGGLLALSANDCGDGICSEYETCNTCFRDCGKCNADTVRNPMHKPATTPAEEHNEESSMITGSGRLEEPVASEAPAMKKGVTLNQVTGMAISSQIESDEAGSGSGFMIAALFVIVTSLVGTAFVMRRKTKSEAPAAQAKQQATTVQISSFTELSMHYPDHAKQLNAFIYKARAAGHTSNAIKGSLLQSGWSEPVVDSAIFREHDGAVLMSYLHNQL